MNVRKIKLKKRKLKIIIGIILLFCMVTHDVTGQLLPEEKSSVYKLNRKLEIPITAALSVTNQLGLYLVGNKPALDSLEVVTLDANDIWKFDRRATQQDPAYRLQAQDISDVAMNITIALPVLLMLDGKMRKDWFDLLILYIQTHAAAGNAYVITAALYDRNRPFVYHAEIPTNHKLSTGTKNSFFSGHTSTTAASSFFMAKVLSDYNPELGNKKFILFAAALVPPTLVAYYRYKAMKHYPTDVLFGMTVGALTGILVPHFHKSKKKTGSFSFLPYAGQVSGLQITYSIR